MIVPFLRKNHPCDWMIAESRIHMTELTKCLLDGVGGFITERRGEILIKVRVLGEVSDD